jgi:multidrug efflux system outer membrane protein
MPPSSTCRRDAWPSRTAGGWLPRPAARTRLVAARPAGNPTLAVRTRASFQRGAVAGAEQAAGGAQAGLATGLNRQRYSANGFFPPPIGGSWYNDAGAGRASATTSTGGASTALVAAALGETNAVRPRPAQAKQALAASVAQSYFRLQMLWARQDNLNALAAVQRDCWPDRKARVAHGLANGDALRGAELDLAKLMNRRRAGDRRPRANAKRCARWSAAGPDDLARFERRLPQTATALPRRLGIELLARRPDLQAARWRVEAQLGRVAASEAAFRPDINLAGAIGLDAVSLGKLLRYPSRTPLLGATLDLPLFDSGRLDAASASPAPNRDELLAEYNEAVLNAVRDVARPRACRASSKEAAGARSRLDASRKLAASAEARQKRGLADRASVLQARWPCCASATRRCSCSTRAADPGRPGQGARRRLPRRPATIAGAFGNDCNNDEHSTRTEHHTVANPNKRRAVLAGITVAFLAAGAAYGAYTTLVAVQARRDRQRLCRRQPGQRVLAGDRQRGRDPRRRNPAGAGRRRDRAPRSVRRRESRWPRPRRASGPPCASSASAIRTSSSYEAVVEQRRVALRTRRKTWRGARRWRPASGLGRRRGACAPRRRRCARGARGRAEAGGGGARGWPAWRRRAPERAGGQGRLPVGLAGGAPQRHRRAGQRLCRQAQRAGRQPHRPGRAAAVDRAAGPALGRRQLQGIGTARHPRRPAGHHRGRHLRQQGDLSTARCGPGRRHRQRLLPAAGAERQRQLDQGGAARAGADLARPEGTGRASAARGPVGHRRHRHQPAGRRRAGHGGGAAPAYATTVLDQPLQQAQAATDAIVAKNMAN